MELLNDRELDHVSGGNPWAIAAGVWLLIEVADALHSAGKSAAEGFDEGYSQVRR